MLTLLVASASVALSQCPPQLFQVPAFGAPGIEVDPTFYNAPAYSSNVTFDTDGADGPLASQLLLSWNEWGRVGTLAPVPQVTAWSGSWSSWSALPQVRQVTPLAVWNGGVLGPGTNLAPGWFKDGAWQSLPPNVSSTVVSGYPDAFDVIDNVPIARGSLTITNPTGGWIFNTWAKYVDGTWQSTPQDTSLRAMTVLHDGVLHRPRRWTWSDRALAERWTGSAWIATQPAPANLSFDESGQTIDDLFSSQGLLYRNVRSSINSGVYVQTNGAWSRLTPPVLVPELIGRTLHTRIGADSPFGTLITYQTFGSQPDEERFCVRIARLRDGEWSVVPGVFSLATTQSLANRSESASIFELLTYGDEILALGLFDRVDGGPALNAAVFDGTSWRTTTPGMMRTSLDPIGLFPSPAVPTVQRLSRDGDDLLVQGSFSVACSDAGEGRDVALFDGAGWRSFGVDLPSTQIESYVTFQGERHISVWMPAQSQNHTYRYRNGQWQRLPIDIENLQVGLDGKLIGGRRTGPFTYELVLWDGTASQSLTSITTSGFTISTFLDRFTVYDNQLYVFTGQLWRYDGSQWHQVSSQFISQSSFITRPLRVLGNSLYYFTGPFQINNIYRFNGLTFDAITPPAPLLDVCMHEDSLHALTINNTLMRLVGSTWITLTTTDPQATSIASAHGVLYVGDSQPFLNASGNPPRYPQPSNMLPPQRLGNLAIYGSPAAPNIRSQDSLVEAASGAPAELRLVHDGIALDNIRWFRDGQPVNLSDLRITARTALDGRTHTLRFRSTTARDAGIYTAQLTSRCNTTTSQPITLITTNAPTNICDTIDFNRNNIYPEDQDVIDFFTVLAGGPCSNGPACGDIDFNNNTVFPEEQDVIDFLTVLAGGSCS